MAFPAKPLTKVPPQRLDPKFLERAVGLVGQIVLAPARGQAQAKPVGRAITNAAKAGRLDESLQQINRMLVELPVVFGRLSARRIFSGPSHIAGSVSFFCGCRHLSVTRS